MKPEFVVPQELVHFTFAPLMKGGKTDAAFIIEQGAEKYVLQAYYGQQGHEVRKKFDVTEQIKSFHPDCQINDIYDYYCDLENQSYLITEFIEGKTLEETLINNECLDEYSIYSELAKTLAQIHSVPCDEMFGMFRGDDIKKAFTGQRQDTFLGYVTDNINFLNPYLENNLSAEHYESILEKEYELFEHLSYNNIKQATLIWKDINANNIMVRDGKFACLIDAGGAAYAIPELDISFLKTNVCKDENEYQIFLSEYKKHNENINETMIDILCILIELEAIMVCVNHNIKIQRPYYSPHFKEIYEKLTPSLKGNDNDRNKFL